MPLFRRRAPEPVPPVEDLDAATVSVAGRDLALREVQVGARVDDGRLSVLVHHPAMPDLLPEIQEEAAHQILAATLGLPLAQQVVADLRPAQQVPIDAFGLPALRSFVESIVSR